MYFYHLQKSMLCDNKRKRIINMRKLFAFGFIATCLTTSCSSTSDYRKGEFFSLEELYSNKTLTSDDILNIYSIQINNLKEFFNGKINE